MSKPLRLHKELSGKHVVWFEESNQWIGFEEPAYNIFKWVEKGQKKAKVVSKICEKYGLNEPDGKRFVNEILEGLKLASLPTKPDSNIQPAISRNPKPFSTRQYLINNKRFEIRYGSKLIEYYIHPPLAHLEKSKYSKADEIFTLLGDNTKYGLISEPTLLNWSTDDIIKLKRRVSLSILNCIYNSNDADWFSRIHASAVSNENHAIILSSESGHGKSTLATLLQTRGFRVLSDDFVPLHRLDQHAYPVPTGLSIKRGSFEVIQNYFSEFDPGKPISII